LEYAKSCLRVWQKDEVACWSPSQSRIICSWQAT
jgi:hypothetical protein